MGFLSGLFGGNTGAGFQAQSAPIAQPGAIDQQQQFLNQLNAAGGIQNQQNVFNQLQGIASGQGPNPAQVMLNQATGQNIAAQASLAAGQRGAGTNAGLIARQAGQQGGALQQNAAGQGAVLQANQSLGALGQMGGIAGQQVGQQQNALSGLGQQQAQYNQQLLGNTQQMNTANAAIAGHNADFQGKLLMGALSGLGAAGQSAASSSATPAAAAAMAHGGKVEPRSSYGRHLAGLGPMTAQGSTVPVMVSPGEKYLSPQQAQEVAQGSKSPMEGKTIPGKAKVKGDSLKNDVVPAQLEEGGVVIPKSILEGPNAAAKAARFVADHLKKSKGKK